MRIPPEAVGEAVFCGAEVDPPPWLSTIALAALQTTVPLITAPVAPESTSSKLVAPETGKATRLPATVIVRACVSASECRESPNQAKYIGGGRMCWDSVWRRFRFCEDIRVAQHEN